MEHDLRLTVFWAVHLALLGLFAIELLFVLSVWLKARVPGLPADASRWRKLGRALSFSLGLVFSRRIWTLLKALVVDGMFHQRLYRTSWRRWAIHISVFGCWMVLGLLSTLTGVIVEILPLLGMSPEAVAVLPVIGQLYHADVWWVAFSNEILGVIVLAGMLLVIYRRYVQKDAQLRTIPADNVVIVLLTLIALSGFPAETFRLLADYTTPTGVFAPDPRMISPVKLPVALYDAWGPQWAFVGYPSAVILGALRLKVGIWEALHNVGFWLHFFLVTALLLLLPFSRFFHVIMSPVIVAYNTMLEQEAPGERDSARREMLEPVA
ncbi:respiratory nitrate reductase subunit gamma [Chloroflexota bacterium]